MAAGGSSMNNQQRQNLLQLLSEVNFPNINDNIQEAVHNGEQEAVNTEEMRRDYLLGKIITDILNNVNPTISNSTLNDLKGKNSSQLWQMIKWAKKVEYGANKESGELKVITMEDMAFDPRIKEEINKVLGRVNSAAAAPSPIETPRTAGLKTMVLDVLIHYFPEEEAKFRKMPLDTLKGYFANLVQQVQTPDLKRLNWNVGQYLLSKAPQKTRVVNLKSKLQNLLPRYANGNLRRFASMNLPELQAELRTLMTSTKNDGKKKEISKAIQEGKGDKEVPLRQLTRPGTRWTMTKQRKGKK